MLFFVEKNCMWTNTPWGSWGPCELKGDCGNGYCLRRKEYCLCGACGNKRNDSVCGIPPRQIKSCYKLCQRKKPIFIFHFSQGKFPLELIFSITFPIKRLIKTFPM